MNILMMTNTFTPHVGGVARSIERFVARYRALGHRVLIVAPEFDDMPANEQDVVRIPAWRHFNHTGFSVALPVPANLYTQVASFDPDIVHAHHPFLIGNTALRIAHSFDVPLVFTHHTKYEDYTHNLPADSPALKRFVERLATNYANTADGVFAPSQSTAELMRRRGVTTPIQVVPTGVDIHHFTPGNQRQARTRFDLPPDGFVIGHLGRLTREKNLLSLVQGVIELLKRPAVPEHTCFVVFGEGPMTHRLLEQFDAYGLHHQVHRCGVIDPEDLPLAYRTMDVFVFASQSETQGMVLTEAMACGIPVVAIDAPGVREVVQDRHNGRQLSDDDPRAFADALDWVMQASPEAGERLRRAARRTAEDFSIEITADRALQHYQALVAQDLTDRSTDYFEWVDPLAVAEAQWQLVKNTLDAASHALDES